MDFDPIPPTPRERVSNFLFSSVIGTILCSILCLVVFSLTFGIGYVVIGIAFAGYINDKHPRGYYGMSGLGIIFLWPVAILVRTVEGRG